MDYINIAALPLEKKRILWARVQESRPELARLWQDAVFTGIRAMFNGEVMLPLADYRQIMGGDA
jgi:hypothetical protein